MIRLLATRLSAFVLLCGAAYAEQPIVHPGVPEVDARPASLRAVFSMRVRSWGDGSPIQVFVLPDENDLHKRFCKDVLGMFPYQIRQAWDRLVFSGIGQGPTRVTSLEEMRDKVASTPGAIGYVEVLSEQGSASSSETSGGEIAEGQEQTAEVTDVRFISVE